MKKDKHVDPIPREFHSLEEAAEFWDTHDTADYPEAFRDVAVEARLKRRHFEVEIDEDVVKVLTAKARRKKSTMGRIASDILRRQLCAS